MDSDRLYLGDAQFSESNKVRIRAALAQNQTLRVLRLPRSTWTDVTVDSLCTLLEHNNTLMSLRLQKAEFTPQELINLCKALTLNTTLRGLLLSETRWTPESSAALCVLMQHSVLQILNLQEASFSPEDFIGLCAAWNQNRTLRLLDLSKSTWNNESLQAFCEYVKVNSSLISLMLRNAALNPQNMLDLVKSLQSNSSLQDFDFMDSLLEEDSIQALCECISKNRTLTRIQFGRSTFSNKAMMCILQSLGRNRATTYINFHGSTLTDAAAPALSAFIENSHMEVLSFGSSKLSDSCLSDMLHSLCQNKTIKNINFTCSALSDRVIPALCKMLQGNVHIKRIRFHSSHFTDGGLSALLQTLTTNKTLQTIDIEDDLTDRCMGDLCTFLTDATSLQEIRGTKATDVKLTWCLREVRKLEKVEKIQFDGELMTIYFTLAGDHDVIRITAPPDWEKAPTLKGQTSNANTPGKKVLAEVLEQAPGKEQTKAAATRSALGPAAAQHKAPEGRSGDTKGKKESWFKALTSRLRPGKPKKPPTHQQTATTTDRSTQETGSARTETDEATLHTSDVPDELYLLDEEYIQAYKEACAGGTQTVYQCRVMLVGHEGAGKTSIKNSLLGQPFQHQHLITNGMEIEVNKTKHWQPIPVDNEHAELVATYMMNAVKLQPEEETQSGPSPGPDRTTSPPQHESSDSTDKGQSGMPTDSDREDDQGLEAYGYTDGRAVRGGNQPTDLSGYSMPQDKGDMLHTTDLSVYSMPQNNPVKQPAIPPDVVEILKRELKDKKPDGRDEFAVELFFWDSGGQGIFYSTTKTFLSRRCVFLLAVDMVKSLDAQVPTYRKDWQGQDVLDTGCPQTVGEHIHYWMTCIHTFVPEKDERPTSSPRVIIVITHKDACTPEQEKAYYKEIREFLKDKPYEEDVQTVFSISNISRDERDLHQLKHTITELAKQQAYLLPITWFAFKDELLKSRSTPVPRMTLEEATNLGLRCGMKGITDVQGALQFFHEIGNILYFNEPTLSDFVITKPQWLVSQFREVLTVPSYHEQRIFRNSRSHFRRLDEEGVLHEEVLQHVWPEEVRKELITLMMKFALLLPMPAGYSLAAAEEEDGAVRYLVPCLLPLADPDLETEATPTSVPALTLLPAHSFIPVGLTSRLFTSLVNEDGWKVADRIYGQSAMFLPKGNDSSVQVTIIQRQGFIELHGKTLMGSEGSGNFYHCLNTILNRLEAITSSLCPLKNVTIGMHCPCCRGRGIKNIIRLGYRGRERKEFMYCTQHKDKCSTSEVAVWFTNVHHMAAHGSESGAESGGVADREMEMFSRAAESIRRELQQELPRLVGSSGLGEFAASVQFLAIIRSLGIIQEHDIQSIEAEPTPGDKADALIKHLLPCSQANLVLFAWLLVDANQAHQLPNSITADLKSWLADQNKEDIMKAAHGSESGAESGGDADRKMETLSRAAESIRRELQQELPRLVGSSGLGVCAASVHFMANIRSLGIIQERYIQSVEAESTPGGKADVLIKHLLLCSQANLVLFAWILVNVDQAHQLPKSIPAGLKSWLADKDKQHIMKVVHNL